MKIILGSFLIAVLLPMGSSLECEVCSGIGTSCTGPMETCAEGQDTCGIILVENSLAGELIQTVTKTCENSYVCDHPLTYMDLGKGRYIRSSVTCCAGDNCKTTYPQPAPVMNKPNGKRCPACYSFSLYDCGTEMVDCVGPENYCLEMVEKVQYGKFVIDLTMKGCVTEEVCAAKEGEAKSGGVHADIAKIACTPASTAV